MKAGTAPDQQSISTLLHLWVDIASFVETLWSQRPTADFRTSQHGARSLSESWTVMSPHFSESVQLVRNVERRQLATLGYEGRTLENYLNELLHFGVTILCDVRRNPISRKYGFSKSTLSKGCEGVGVRYEHIPELGIASERRRSLESQADYDALFAEYKRDNLPQQASELATIRGWLQNGEHVALTCYERQPHQCHRHCVAEVLATDLGKSLVVKHL